MYISDLSGGVTYEAENFSLYYGREYPTSWLEHCHYELELILFLENPSAQLSWQTAHGQREEEITSEQLCLILPKQPHKITWHKVTKIIALYLQPQFLFRLAEKIPLDNNNFSWDNYVLEDDLIQKLSLCLLPELKQARPKDAYLDSIVNALTIHLISNYGIHFYLLEGCRLELEQPEISGGLSRYQLDRTLLFINANLDRSIKIEDIASEINVSIYYFIRLFKESTGISPYQYILRQRVEKSRQLIEIGKLPLCDIALECGFSSQSQFSYHFKRQTGMSPKRYKIKYQQSNLWREAL